MGYHRLNEAVRGLVRRRHRQGARDEGAVAEGRRLSFLAGRWSRVREAGGVVMRERRR